MPKGEKKNQSLITAIKKKKHTHGDYVSALEKATYEGDKKNLEITYLKNVDDCKVTRPRIRVFVARSPADKYEATLESYLEKLRQTANVVMYTQTESRFKNIRNSEQFNNRFIMSEDRNYDIRGLTLGFNVLLVDNCDLPESDITEYSKMYKTTFQSIIFLKKVALEMIHRKKKT